MGHRPSSVFLDQLYQRVFPSVINGSRIEAGIVDLDGILDGHTLYVKTLEKIIASIALQIETQRATRTTKKSNTFNKHNKDFHAHHTFLSHFFAFTARLRREISLYDVLWKT